MTDLFEQAGVQVDGDWWCWHLHGRYMVRESAGWPTPRTRRRVWRYDECVSAPTEVEARARFLELTGPTDRHHQWLHLSRGRKIKKRKSPPV